MQCIMPMNNNTPIHQLEPKQTTLHLTSETLKIC